MNWRSSNEPEASATDLPSVADASGSFAVPRALPHGPAEPGQPGQPRQPGEEAAGQSGEARPRPLPNHVLGQVILELVNLLHDRLNLVVQLDLLDVVDELLGELVQLALVALVAAGQGAAHGPREGV